VAAGSLTSREWVVLLAAAVLLFNVVEGFTKGSAHVVYRTVKRSEDAALYWVAMVISFVLGVGGILVTIL
jgi:hypothetical protein